MNKKMNKERKWVKRLIRKYWKHYAILYNKTHTIPYGSDVEILRSAYHVCNSIPGRIKLLKHHVDNDLKNFTKELKTAFYDAHLRMIYTIEEIEWNQKQAYETQSFKTKNEKIWRKRLAIGRGIKQ